MSHGTITITSPTTGTTWYKGNSQTITWTKLLTGVTWNYFNIYLYSSSGLEATITTNLSHNNSASQTYTYTPPTSLDTGTDYFVKITGDYDDSGGGV